jgi:hypothetical protein
LGAKLRFLTDGIAFLAPKLIQEKNSENLINNWMRKKY